MELSLRRLCDSPTEAHDTAPLCHDGGSIAALVHIIDSLDGEEGVVPHDLVDLVIDHVGVGVGLLPVKGGQGDVLDIAPSGIGVLALSSQVVIEADYQHLLLSSPF